MNRKIEGGAGTCKAGAVYIIAASDTPYWKIGRSISPGRRLKQVGLMSPVPLKSCGWYYTLDASAEEKYWHQKFAHRRVRGEWFDLSPAEERDLLLTVIQYGYQDMVEFETATARDEMDARRLERNFRRRVFYRLRKLSAQTKESRRIPYSYPRGGATLRTWACGKCRSEWAEKLAEESEFCCPRCGYARLKQKQTKIAHKTIWSAPVLKSAADA